MTAANALFCQELKELMVESGRVFKVPEQIARTVSSSDPDTRFVKSWAVIHRLIPSDGQVSVAPEA
ncbi:hypothetical protein [Pseudomonas brassicacearum]|uniref:hypothetical protein n=1 Tax=Pseudomonas brassicacearum TaxID=930166 RepID=UPI0006403F6D|nr:hypothetical protein [Pseudomonas brassicacearum]